MCLDVLIDLHPGSALVPIVQDAFPFRDAGVIRVARGQVGHLKRVRLDIVQSHFVATRLAGGPVKPFCQRISGCANAHRLNFGFDEHVIVLQHIRFAPNDGGHASALDMWR